MSKEKVKQSKPKADVGAPTKYTPDLALRICQEIASCTESYDKIAARNPDFPDKSTFRRWRYKDEKLRTMYDQAKRDQCELFIEELRDQARDDSGDILLGHQGPKANPAAVARHKLIIETDKWIATKYLPKIYGDKAEDKPPASADELRAAFETLDRMIKEREQPY